LCMVAKRGTAMFRLKLNLRYVHSHIEKKVFNFEELKDHLAKRGDHAVPHDLMSGYYQVGLYPRSRTFVGFKWEGQYFVYN